MSKIEVNQISSQCGSTLTIGQSGDTVTLASGATQSGFGRTGTVDWCTTAKTAPFTGVSGKGYFVNTSCGAITVTLPASPSAGDIISIKDYARTAGINNINLCRNGSKIDGACTATSINTAGQSVTLIYVDATKGWTAILSNDTKSFGAAFVTATGGTITESGDYRIHTFTADGCFSVSCAGNPFGSTTVDYLVVAGGGGNGVGSGGGGGGAGGARMSGGTASGCYTASPLGLCVAALPVTATTYPITVGAGGTGAPDTSVPSACAVGSPSVFSTITSTGGGGGGSESPAPANKNGNPGGSGGGGSYVPCNAGGSGNTPPTTPPQGKNGGTGQTAGGYAGAGGGGAACAGAGGNGGPGAGGPGGNGISNSITGSATYYAGGGGGGSQSGSPGAVPAGTGGLGGGGTGSARCGTIGQAGTANTGGGAGGGWSWTNPTYAPLNGGSGIVIIRYKYQ